MELTMYLGLSEFDCFFNFYEKKGLWPRFSYFYSYGISFLEESFWGLFILSSASFG